MCFPLNHRHKAAQDLLCAEGKVPTALQDTCPNRAGDTLENSWDLPHLKVMQ